MTETTARAVIAVLSTQGIDAYWEYPGFLSIPLADERIINLSDEEPVFSTQVVNVDGDFFDMLSVDSDIPSTSDDVTALVDFLAAEVKKVGSHA